MNRIKEFFLMCSGSDRALLEKCPTEHSKYTGLGATVFFTGVFAAAAAGYALHMVFDSVWIAVPFGIIWGLMIFNLDRYIVSSMRKEGNLRKEIATAVPRVILAIIISIVIAKPLELKIFQKEINPELRAMEQETYAKQEASLKLGFLKRQDSLKSEISVLKKEIEDRTAKRDQLVRMAQEEADGTGGSRRRNLGPIYKAKKADADRAEEELRRFVSEQRERIGAIENSISQNDRAMDLAVNAIQRTKIDGPAARLEALSRLSSRSAAIGIANWFLILLFIAIETTPVVVKLMSPKGPYDNLLKIEEHMFAVMQVEEMAKTNSASKERSGSLTAHEKEFVRDRLDSALK